MSENTERDDPEQAERDARQFGRRIHEGCQHRLGCTCVPPHYLRCTWYRGAERCLLGDGHVTRHNYPKKVLIVDEDEA